MVEVGDDGDCRGISQVAEHRGEDGEGRVGARARSGLQDEGAVLGLGGAGVGEGVFPARTTRPATAVPSVRQG